MSQFEFNGLLDSALPNIYINRITLEQKSLLPLSNNKYDPTPHINQALTPSDASPLGLQIQQANPDLLSVTFDSFIEFPNLSDANFFSLESLGPYLTINLFLFNAASKDSYDFLISSAGTEFLAKPLTANSVLQQYLDGNGLVAGTDYKHVALPGADYLPWPSSHAPEYPTGPAELATMAAAFKQKYSKVLPDGTTVYKVPISINAEINGAFPSELFALAFCAVDIDAMNLEKYGEGVEEAEIVPIGRIAKEIIIQNGKLQNKGMMFFVSDDQSVPDNAELSKAREVAFNHLKGQLWFGGIHKSGARFMAGNSHISSMHPYLDYIVVPNQRIHDYRMMQVMQKQLMSFDPITNLVFGGDYIDFRSNTAAADLDNPALFSDLMSSVDREGTAKLFFSIDWGKLIKKYCALPNLIDKASSFPEELQGIFSPGAGVLRPRSFKIFRERVDIPPSVVDEESNRKLIYDNYPQFYFFDQVGTTYQLDGTPLKKPVLSSLVPVKLAPNKTSFNGKVRHYSLTDYEIPKTEKGKFRYSIEIEIPDPTIPYLMSKYTLARTALKELKKYITLAQSADQSGTPYYNKYLGEFTQEFWNKAFGGSPDSINLGPVTMVFDSLQFLATATRSDWTKPDAAISVDDFAGEPSGKWSDNMNNMLGWEVTSPDSITAVYNICNTLTSQLKNIIEGFSTANIPKTETSFVEVDGEQKETAPPFTKMPIGSDLPQRIMTVNYAFDDPADFVSTEQLDAGYDFFAEQENQYTFNNGLKVINWSSYTQRSENEYKKYFKNDINQVVPNGFELGADKIGYPFTMNSTTAKGRFFTISKSWPNSQESSEIPHVVLPRAIGEWEGDAYFSGTKISWIIDAFNKLANNIIRYNFNLLGNPGPKNFLGYGPNDPIPGDEVEIVNEMKRIIKEYQSLSFKGAVFGREKYRALEISSVKASGDNPSVDDFTPPETGAITISGMLIEPGSNVEQKMPWQKIIGQEDLLLSLIMQNYLKLGHWDTKLRSFNTKDFDSRLGTHLNNVLLGAAYDHEGKYIGWPWYLEPKVWADMGSTMEAVSSVLQPAMDALPNQIKVLMINNYSTQGALDTPALVGSLNSQVQYVIPKEDPLYSAVPAGIQTHDPAVRNQTMFLNRFGEFWFRHQNIVEVEYLQGYLATSKIPGAPSGKYEDTYNSSVKTPFWTPLTSAELNAPNGGLLLCRFKKYKNPEILNQNVNNILDLPLYDEYFFIKPVNLQLPNQSATDQNEKQTITEPT